MPLMRCPMAAQRGLSLVELLVGITVGLFVVAAATLVVSTQLGDNRRLLTETQMQQDLRATADIITRELRRAGAWGVPSTAAGAVWTPVNSAGTNPNVAVTPAVGVATQVDYLSSRTPGQNGPYGFRLAGGAIETLLAGGGWQQLTDRAVMEVTTFTVTPQNEAPLQVPCPKPCPDMTTNCWPTVTVRAFAVDITARAVSDATVVRSVRSTVRLRNDLVQFNDPLNPTLACPA